MSRINSRKVAGQRKDAAQSTQLENPAYLEQQAGIGVKQLDLFSAQKYHPVVGLLEDLNPDDLSPKLALELLYRLKGMI